MVREPGKLGKVVSREEILLKRSEWDEGGKRVVFVAGCFDLLHPGHTRLLEQARAYGDVVLVGVLGDETVQRITANSHPSVKRPVTPASERAEVLAALAAVDYAIELDARGIVPFLRELRPTVIVDGAEPTSASPFLATSAKTAGVELVRIPIEPGHSSSRLIERIAQLPA